MFLELLQTHFQLSYFLILIFRFFIQFILHKTEPGYNFFKRSLSCKILKITFAKFFMDN